MLYVGSSPILSKSVSPYPNQHLLTSNRLSDPTLLRRRNSPIHNRKHRKRSHDRMAPCRLHPCGSSHLSIFWLLTRFNGEEVHCSNGMCLTLCWCCACWNYTYNWAGSHGNGVGWSWSRYRRVDCTGWVSYLKRIIRVEMILTEWV
jgi:hypothetical protein